MKDIVGSAAPPQWPERCAWWNAVWALATLHAKQTGAEQESTCGWQGMMQGVQLDSTIDVGVAVMQQ